MSPLDVTGRRAKSLPRRSRVSSSPPPAQPRSWARELRGFHRQELLRKTCPPQPLFRQYHRNAIGDAKLRFKRCLPVFETCYRLQPGATYTLTDDTFVELRSNAASIDGSARVRLERRSHDRPVGAQRIAVLDESPSGDNRPGSTVITASAIRAQTIPPFVASPASSGFPVPPNVP